VHVVFFWWVGWWLRELHLFNSFAVAIACFVFWVAVPDPIGADKVGFEAAMAVVGAIFK
jgi:hypothetical protein